MVSWKIVRKIIVLIGIVLTAFTPDLYSQNNGVWQSYTSTSQIRAMEFFDGYIQVATSGGWLKIDPSTLELTKLINVDGLGTSDLYDIMRDASGNIWLGGYGRLVKFRNGIYTPYLFLDSDDNLLTINAIEDDNDNLWLGTSIGLALFSKSVDGGQIEDFYFRFADLNAQPIVNDVLTVGDEIYLATTDGLAIADKRNPDQLKSFANWIGFSSANAPELVGDTITALAYFENSVFLGTTENAFRMDISGNDTSFVTLATRDPDPVNDMVVDGNTLMIYARDGIYRYTSGLTDWLEISTFPSGSRFSTGKYIGGVHWTGVEDNGLYYELNGNYIVFLDGGLPYGEVTALASSSVGRIAGGFFDREIGVFDSLEWGQIDVAQIVPFGVGAGCYAVAVDNQNRIWAGSKGNGLMHIFDDTVINYDQNNSTLRGVDEGVHYVVIYGLTVSLDYLFVSNYRARDDNPISVADLSDTDRWISFGINDGITTDLTNSIDYHDGVIAIGTELSGVFYYYCGPDPFNKTDDSVAHMREDNRYLGSNNVNVVKFDNRGNLWVGTKFGLSFYDYGIDRFVNVNLPLGFGPAITSLAFDKRNNIWVGARNGLAFYNNSTEEYTVYTILNSGLPDNHVTALAVNQYSSDLWVGTKNGVARYKTFFGRVAANLDEIYAFPNPFYIVDGSETLSFNFGGNAHAWIYSASGELVNDMEINIPWDGRNWRGEDVASGVYMILLRADDGSHGKTKVMLIRK
jgi:ligand-binding sensor domain-containing protein